MGIIEIIILIAVSGFVLHRIFSVLIAPFICKDEKERCGSCPFADGCGKKR